MTMTIEDIQEFQRNAVSILEKNSQYATARAVERAFSALICLEQYKFERDIAVSQLRELGLELGQKIDGVYLTKDEYQYIKEYMNLGD